MVILAIEVYNPKPDSIEMADSIQSVSVNIVDSAQCGETDHEVLISDSIPPLIILDNSLINSIVEIPHDDHISNQCKRARTSYINQILEPPISSPIRDPSPSQEEDQGGIRFPLTDISLYPRDCTSECIVIAIAKSKNIARIG